MYNSRIIALIKDAAIIIKQYCESSVIIIAFVAIHRFFIRQTENSSILTFFRKDWKVELAWRNSVLFIPFSLFAKLGTHVIKKQELLNNEKISESRILSSFRSSIKSVFSVNTRSLGVVLLIGVLTESVLTILFQDISLIGSLLRLFLLFFSLCLILINRSIISLYEGSWVLQYIINFFIVRGIGDAARVK